MPEKEPFQLDYERYAINKTLQKIAKKLELKTVLEVPAMGLKALPSLYSLGYAEAGCQIDLINPEPSGLAAWKELGYTVNSIHTKKLHQLPIKDNTYDLVWNFASFPMLEHRKELLDEMKRVSKKYVMILCVNGYNVGSPIHRTLHKINKVPWTHGDKYFLYPKNLRAFMKEAGLKIVKSDVMNCPIWPDTVGFRDMKFHKMENTQQKKPENIEWEANTLTYMKNKNYPSWIKAMYTFESIPLPLFLKHTYSHLYYVIGEKQ
ncbi:MAG: methyltransferase domain-containing protein [Candidatus Nanoarchaeia archaeon]